MIKLDKILLKFFSGLIFIISILTTLLITNLFDFNYYFAKYIENIAKIDTNYKKVILGICLVILIFTIKGMLFVKGSKPEVNGVQFKSKFGMLEITKSYIEKVINNSITKDTNLKVVNTKVKINNKNEILVNLNIVVKENEKSYLENTNDKIYIIQEEIKKVINSTTNLKVVKIDITLG